MRIALACFTLVFMTIINCSENVNGQQLLTSDYRIFRNTTAWELAKAIHDEDVTKINQIVDQNKSLIKVIDPQYKQTLLGLAVVDQKYNSVKSLLELGADPNVFNNYDGETPFMQSIEIGGRIQKNDPRFLNLLLKYGGNPNLKSIHVDYGPGVTSPLIIAAEAGNLEYIQILVRGGANLVQDENDLFYAALFSESPDVVLYLINKGFDYKKPIRVAYDSKTDICKELRRWRFDLTSENYKKKMEIVGFLKSHSIDYRATPIPKDYYNICTKEYLNKY